MLNEEEMQDAIRENNQQLASLTQAVEGLQSAHEMDIHTVFWSPEVRKEDWIYNYFGAPAVHYLIQVRDELIEYRRFPESGEYFDRFYRVIDGNILSILNFWYVKPIKGTPAYYDGDIQQIVETEQVSDESKDLAVLDILYPGYIREIEGEDSQTLVRPQLVRVGRVGKHLSLPLGGGD